MPDPYRQDEVTEVIRTAFRDFCAEYGITTRNEQIWLLSRFETAVKELRMAQ